MDVVWDGITRAETLREDAARLRQELADAAKGYNWPRVFEILSGEKELINTTRPDGHSLYAPLHQVAHGGADVEVAQRLIEMHAFRTLRNARGERPVDVAARRGHRHLVRILTPEYKHHVPLDELLKVQENFHAVIHGRAENLMREHGLRLPELEPLLELDRPQMWFPVPGMYGGFSYRLTKAGPDPVVVSESWCRVAEGSGQRHEVTARGSRLLEEGFV